MSEELFTNVMSFVPSNFTLSYTNRFMNDDMNDDLKTYPLVLYLFFGSYVYGLFENEDEPNPC